jgi:hypothetical protein
MTEKSPDTVVDFTGNFPIEFCKLCDALENAFCEAPDNAEYSRGSNMRTRYIIALGKLARFFHAVGGDGSTDIAARGVAMRFMDLAGILQDLEEGLSHPVLKANDKIGRKVRFDVWVLRDMVVRGLQVLVMSGMDSTVAARTIAKRFPSLDRLKRDARDDLTTAILSWEKNLREGTISNEIVRDVHSGGVDFLNQTIGQASPDLLKLGADDLKVAAYTLIEKAAARARSLILDNDFSSEPTTISPDGTPTKSRAVA